MLRLYSEKRNQRMANVWARKPMKMLLAEAGESGEHSLKRTLGPFQLTALGVGAVIGAGIFVLSGTGRALRRAGADALVRLIREWDAPSPPFVTRNLPP